MIKKCILGISMAWMFFLLPSGANAFMVTSTAPGYSSSFFHSLNISTNALEFDAAGNIYAVNMTGIGSGTSVIERFDFSSGYASSSVFTSFSSLGDGGVNGLAFDGLGNLYSSGATGVFDSGVIYKTALSTMTTSPYHTLTDFRPTGVTADALGNLYFSGRRASEPATFGNLYKLDSSKALSIIVPNFISRGVAIDGSGNLFASNLADNNLYRFAYGSTTPEFIASFDIAPAELTFDELGNLYAFEHNFAASSTEIYKITAASVPEPSTILLLGSGLVGLGLTGWRKRSKKA